MLRDEIQATRDKMQLNDEVILTGKLENPYPLLKQCNCLVLWSDYEGTPVTIDEAGVLGIPVLANDVGGVREQIAGTPGSSIVNTVEEYVCAIIGHKFMRYDLDFESRTKKEQIRLITTLGLAQDESKGD